MSKVLQADTMLTSNHGVITLSVCLLYTVMVPLLWAFMCDIKGSMSDVSNRYSLWVSCEDVRNDLIYSWHITFDTSRLLQGCMGWAWRARSSPR